MEKQLNKKRFERHWLLDGHFVALAAKQYWQFTPKKGWRRYAGPVPFKEHSKVYEDVDYLVYNEGRGEFGGRIFFFDKQTAKTYTTESSGAVWVRHTTQGYEVLANLGRMLSSASMQLIPDPRALPLWDGDWMKRPDPSVSSTATTRLFGYSDIQLFGAFERQGQLAYLSYIADRTVLTMLSHDTFTVVDPLLNKRIYTNDPVTTHYNGVDLINIDYFSMGGQREVMCIFIKGNEMTFLFWL